MTQDLRQLRGAELAGSTGAVAVTRESDGFHDGSILMTEPQRARERFLLTCHPATRHPALDCSSMSADEAIPPEGRPFGDYVLVRHLARGGMADIFVAKSPVGRPVVVKRIRTKMARDPQFVKLFLREASIAMRLSHGNVAQVFDFGEVDGEYYLAMEYVPGVSLYRLMHHGAERGLLLPFPIAAHIVAEVCRGLDHAHRLADDDGRNLGIVHRDVTPQNILVSYDGEVKLVDFGIARARTEANLTRPGVARGKYAYLSPEQVRQRPVDHRTDVWSCGVVLHQLLSGQHPFPGEVMAVLEAIAGGKFPSPRAVDPTVPDALSSAVMRAMAHDPGARHASAAELERELVGWLHAAGPPLSNETVAAYVRHACPEDEDGGLRGEPVPFPPALADWRRDVTAAPPAPAEAETDAHPVPLTTGVIRLRRRRSWGVAAAAILAASALVAFLIGREGATTSSFIETQPRGAEILLDGRDIGATTPHVLEGLEPGRVHGLTLNLEGHQTWMGAFTAGDSVRQVLVPRPDPQAEAAPVPRRPRIEDVMEASERGATEEPEGPAVRDEDLGRVLVDLATLPLASLALDPTRTHRFEVSGAMPMEGTAGRMSVPSVLWYATYPDAPDRTGFMGGIHGTTLSLPAGATSFRAGVLDRGFFTPREGQIIVREVRTGESITIEPRRHLTRMNRSGERRMEALVVRLHRNRRSRVTVTLEGDMKGGPEGIVLWRALPPHQGALMIVHAMQSRGIDGDSWVGQVTVDSGAEIEGHGWLNVFLLHPDPASVTGRVRVQVEDIGPSSIAADLGLLGTTD
jgi:eukaryotic-like serine/threonine-protein kinase